MLAAFGVERRAAQITGRAVEIRGLRRGIYRGHHRRGRLNAGLHGGNHFGCRRRHCGRGVWRMKDRRRRRRIRRSRFRRDCFSRKCRRRRRNRNLRRTRLGSHLRGMRRLIRRRRKRSPWRTRRRQFGSALVTVFRTLKVVGTAVVTSNHSCNSLRSSENFGASNYEKLNELLSFNYLCQTGPRNRRPFYTQSSVGASWPQRKLSRIIRAFEDAGARLSRILLRVP